MMVEMKQGRHSCAGRGKQHPSCLLSICSSPNRLFSTCWSRTDCQNEAGLCADGAKRRADR